jgi:hypothetical protein
VKKYSLAFSFLAVSFVIAFFSCKKINEATELGGDLIPAVDNVNTFQVELDANTSNHIFFNDSTRVNYSDAVALGHIVDPEFGTTHANFDFSIVPNSLGTYPFISRTNLTIDSVVLSLAYAGGYGDTANGTQTVNVFEISPSAGFRVDTLYKYADPSSDFPTTGGQLGSATFQVSHLKDTFRIVRPGDTTTAVNVLRIRLNTALGQRFAQYDTSSTSPSGGFATDSIFRTLFKGLSVQSVSAGNVLTYWNLSDLTNTKLSVYFKAINNSDTTKSVVNFTHAVNGQSNYINRQHSTNVSTGGSDKLYIQSTPGSYASIIFPGLDTFKNKVIHRAEIIASILPSAGSSLFTPPTQLLLDRVNKTRDTAFILHNDLSPGIDGSVNFASFGGNLRLDNTYRFTITRYVQDIITRHQPNDSLRLYAPLRAILFATNLGVKIQVPVIPHAAEGRVVLAGGNNTDPNLRLRLRIIYSNL